LKRIIISAIIVAVLLIITATIFVGTGKYAITYNRPSVSDSQELKDLRIRENEELSSYRLIDSNKGIYQIPIDSAMEKFIAGNKN
jgi:hypothetical protein